MAKIALIEEFKEYSQVAILQDGILTHYFCDTVSNRSIKGSIYLGKICSIENSLQAYFVNYGGHKNGFLPFSSAKGSLRLNDLVIVQVTKDSRESKGVALTMFYNLVGQYCILTSYTKSSIAISKKITNSSIRQKLTNCLKDLQPKCGVIIRTAAKERSTQCIVNDYLRLYNIWQDINTKYNTRSNTSKEMLKNDAKSFGKNHIISSFNNKNNDNNLISKFTENPNKNSDIVYCIPILGSYKSLSSYKYKIKLIPGKQKKNKIIKTIISHFIKLSNQNDKETFLIKKIDKNLLDKCILSHSQLVMSKK